MTAYMMVHRRKITDSDTLKEYRKGIDETLEKFGGRVLAREDEFEVIEGDWHSGRSGDDSEPERVTLISFPDMKSLREWYRSDAYEDLKAIRQKSSVSDIIAVEGQ